MNPIVKFLLALVAIVVLVLVVLTFASGPVVKHFVNSHGRSLIGREVYVEDASLNFFTGSLQLDSLFVAEPDGTTRFMSVHEFKASISVPKLLFGTYDLNHVEVDQLRIDIQQKDTVFNFSDILHFIGADQETDDEPLPLVLRNIDIHNSHIHYQDLLVHSDFQIRDFSLFIPGIDLRDINTSVGVELSLVDGGKLVTKVDYDERNSSYKVNLKLDDFNLQSVLPYVRQQIAFGEFAGTLNLDLEMKGSIKHMLNFSLRGNAGVRDLNILDPDGHPMVQCDTVSIGVRDLDLPQNRIELSRIEFLKPFVRIDYGKDSLDNFSRLMVKASEDAAESEGEMQEAETAVSFNGKEKSLRLVIDRLSVKGASLSYRDESLVAEPFVYQLSNVDFTAPNFTLDGVNHIKVSAQLGAEGRLYFDYNGLISDQRNMKMTVMADRIDFSDFSPYTVQMFGNEVTGGKLSVNMLAQTNNGELYGQNRFVLTNPKVEKKRRGIDPEMNIPFRAGMYLLTDRNDVCDIDLPVKGNIDEPRFSYKRLIFRTLGKLIVKVATSPFRRQKSSSGTDYTAGELLELDNRSLDEINLDSIGTDIMKDE